MSLEREYKYIALFLFAWLLSLSCSFNIKAAEDENMIIPDKIFYTAGDKIKRYALHLREYVKKSTGKNLSLRKYQVKADTSKSIIIGLHGELAKLGILKAEKKLHDSQTLEIIGDGNRVILSGGSTAGLYYAVQEFLERFLGIRWLTPWETSIPHCSELRVPSDLKIIESPAFEMRGLHICFSGRDWYGRIKGHYDEKTLEWMRNNKMNVKFAHNDELEDVGNDLERLDMKPLCLGNAFDQFCPKSLFNEHPEWFPLINGKRVGNGVVKRCVSNREFREHMIKRVLEFIRQHPETDVISIQPTDGYGWCECEECRALDTPEDRKTGMVSGRMFDYATEIAAKVREKYPEKYVSMASYNLYLNPPGNMKKSSNLLVGITMSRSFAHSIDDPSSKVNKEIFERFKKFVKKAGYVAGYEYFSMSGMPIPCSGISETLDAFARLGVKIYFGEIRPDREYWDIAMIPLYFVAKKTWNIKAEPRKVITDFCNSYYGPASAEMVKYFMLLEKAFSGGPEAYMVFCPQSAVHFFTPEIAAKCAQIIDKALASLKAEKNKFYEKRVLIQKKLLQKRTSGCRRMREKDFGPEYAEALEVPPTADPEKFVSELPATVPTLERGVLEKTGQLSVAYDDDNIYLYFRCDENDIGRALETASKDNALEGSRIDFFLSPEPQTGYYYQFLVNPHGALFTQKCKGRSWDSSWTPRVVKKSEMRNNTWTLYMKIPVQSMGVKSLRKGDEWRAGFNYVRRWESGQCQSGWPNGMAMHKIAGLAKLVFK